MPADSTDRPLVSGQLRFGLSEESEQHRNKLGQHVASREIRKENLDDAQRLLESGSVALRKQISVCCLTPYVTVSTAGSFCCQSSGLLYAATDCLDPSRSLVPMKLDLDEEFDGP
jgi:hypothetical protein